METKLIQITSGKGPVECERAVAKVMQKMMDEAKSKSIEATVMETVKGQMPACYFSATLLLKGNQLDAFGESWNGVVLWIAQSPYRKFHKRKNWFVGVHIYDMDKELKINDSDISYQTTRSSGPGGQHVNKTETAVRATHLSSGISVLASNERSQLLNKKLAYARLKEKVYAQELEQIKASVQTKWLKHHQLERGNPLRIYQEPLG